MPKQVRASSDAVHIAACLKAIRTHLPALTPIERDILASLAERWAAHDLGAGRALLRKPIRAARHRIWVAACVATALGAGAFIP